jgi:hypothetical protein
MRYGTEGDDSPNGGAAVWCVGSILVAALTVAVVLVVRHWS